jgi:Cupin-like domain
VAKKMLPPHWRCWVADNVLQEVSPELIEDQAALAGIERSLVRDELTRIAAHPYIEAGRRLSQKMNKLESLLRVRVEVARQNSQTTRIPQRTKLPAAEFRNKYYARNRPVKLKSMMEEWPALWKWSPEYLRRTFGDQIVEITAARDTDPKYEINLEDHRKLIKFGDFIDLVTSTPSGNDSYLVANNSFFERPGLRRLLTDIGSLPGYLTRKAKPAHTHLWFGPADTVTPLHHDTMNILFCQVYGKKRVTLIAPDESPWLYNELGVYSEVEFENPDLETYPLFQHVDAIRVDVNPGEILFIPVGWWHHVRSLETSISVSFTNFAFPNDYEWRLPDIRRNS